jgi:hypothetical protein
MQWIRSHLSFANSISLIALFVALGGTSLAAVTLTKNSVGTKQIKKDAVTASEVKRNAVGASEIRSNAIASGDIADNGVGGADLSDSSVGAGELSDNSVGSGEVTDGSLTENDLVPGLLDLNVTTQFTQSGADLANGAEVSIDAFCPEGQIGIGGGVRGDLTNSELTKVTANRPAISSTNTGAPVDGGTFTGWRGTFVNENNGAGIRPEVWVVCATP